MRLPCPKGIADPARMVFQSGAAKGEIGPLRPRPERLIGPQANFNPDISPQRARLKGWLFNGGVDRLDQFLPLLALIRGQVFSRVIA
jgi:hypothetical protein